MNDRSQPNDTESKSYKARVPGLAETEDPAKDAVHFTSLSKSFTLSETQTSGLYLGFSRGCHENRICYENIHEIDGINCKGLYKNLVTITRNVGARECIKGWKGAKGWCDFQINVEAIF